MARKRTDGRFARPKYIREKYTPVEIWEGNLRRLRRIRAQIAASDPIAGSKWQQGMLDHYDALIAECLERKPPQEVE